MNSPRILIVSNNSLSLTKNNGKTLESFFKDYSKDKIAQLYFSDEIPESNICKNFFNISDKKILNKLLGKKETKTITSDYQIKKVSNLKRLAREFLWNKKLWNTLELNNWLESFKPDIIFFMAGDSGFAYRIVKYIEEKFNAKLVTYITDDYILPRYNFSLTFYLRRIYIKNQMKKTVKRSKIFYTVSEKMRETYKKILKKDSYVIRNCTILSNEFNPYLIDDFKNIQIVYAGGLNFGRDKVIVKLVKAIKKFNDENSKKVYLNIYSNDMISSKLNNKLNVEGVSKFCGKVNQSELKEKLLLADILLFVESFSKSAIASTKLSFSTKIQEYITFNKCILTIGPLDSASIEYLSHFSYGIYSLKDIDEKIKKLFESTEIINNYAKKSLAEHKQVIKNYDTKKLILDKLLYLE